MLFQVVCDAGEGASSPGTSHKGIQATLALAPDFRACGPVVGRRVVWVVGLGLGDDFRVTGATASVLVLRVRSLGDKL